MLTIWFRFYGALNDFLPYHRRHTRFVVRLREPASVKDTIEAIGVPHPEVDLIVINHTPSDSSARLCDADHVSVFPVFSAIAIPEHLRISGSPPEPIRFAADIHLRKLAGYLRLAGFDTVIESDDGTLAALGARNGRVVLTRDVALLKRGIVTHGHWVRHTNPEWQLVEIMRRFELVTSMRPFSRCTRCNDVLVNIGADAAASRLLPCTREEFSEFRECVGCGRVYWRGSHWVRLRALLERATSRVRESGPFCLHP